MPVVHGHAESFTVTFSRTEVLDFISSWPCSGLPDSAISFDFSHGDLVDVSTDYDGADLLALSYDASAFAAEHFGRRDLVRGEP